MEEKHSGLHDEHEGQPPLKETSSQDDDIPRDPQAEKRLLRKIDLHLIPILSLLFLLAFLDRSNIGNARIQGMTMDLHITAANNGYNIALFSFFPLYILCELPSNLILRKVRPSTFLSAIMVLWGIATIGQGLVTNIAGLACLRALLGLFEAGFTPGAVYLISMYYQRFETQRRFTLFFCSSIISGAFSGLLAYAIANMSGVGGYGGWRWIFILEGLLTVVVAVAAKWIIADWPEQAKFLNEDERRLLKARLRDDGGAARMNRFDARARRRTFGDWKIYVGTLIYLGIVNTSYSTAFFVPTIIQELGFTATAAQVRTIPVYVVATLTAILAAFATDKLRIRSIFCVGGTLITTLGLGLLLSGDRVAVGVRYFAVFCVTAGTYIAQPISLIWISNNMGGHYKRSVSSAIMVGFGNVGGIVASNVFLPKESPRYPTGYGVCLGLHWMSALLCGVLAWGMHRENQKRDRGERDYRYQEADIDNMGDDHPTFRYVF